MSSNVELLAFHCPACKREFAVERESIKAPLYCGWCHVTNKRKVGLARDYEAEGSSGIWVPERPKADGKQQEIINEPMERVSYGV